MVHESSDEKIAVVGIIYKTGRPDTFLSEVFLLRVPLRLVVSFHVNITYSAHSLLFLQLMEHIKEVADTEEKETNVGIVDPRHIKIGSRKYYRYMGSLTTPPCTQGVVWTITKKVISLLKSVTIQILEA